MSVDDIIERIPGRFLAWAAIAYNYTTTAYQNAKQFLTNLKKAYSILARPHYYVFFEGSSAPYSIYDVVCWASGSAAPDMLYWADSKVFMPWVPGGLANIPTFLAENASSALPILSLEIVEPKTERVIYDLTEFIEGMRMIELAGLPVPTIQHIISAWTLSSGVVPDFTKYVLRYVDTNGDTYPAAPEVVTPEPLDLSGAVLPPGIPMSPDLSGAVVLAEAAAPEPLDLSGAAAPV